MAVTSKNLPAKTPVTPDAGGAATRRISFIEWLAPEWGRKAALQIEGYAAYSGGMAFFCMVVVILTLVVGFLLLFGDGFATIQGVRFTLTAFGLTVRTDNFPPGPWWIIQVVLVMIQVFFKKIRFLRPLWTPAYVFNATTTAVFIAIWLCRQLGLPPDFIQGVLAALSGTWLPLSALGGVAAVAALLGHILALGAEQVTLTGLCMAGAIFSGIRAKT